MKTNTDNTARNNTLCIKAVGDICPGDKSILGMGVCSLTKKNNINFPFKKIEDIFIDTDIVIGNLEGLLTKCMENVSIPHLAFCGLPLFANELKSVGFNVLNLANNHTLEHGPECFNETVDVLGKAGIRICGLRGFGEYYSKPVFIEKNNCKVGILGYNWVGKDKFPNADQFIAQSHDSIVNYTWNRNSFKDKELQRVVFERNKNVISDIRILKRNVDIVILMTHWGYEFVHYPPYGVTLEAHAFIDAGVDLIIGGHPHVLQGMEQYKGKWIFYSLGNFIFDMKAGRTRQSAVLKCEILNNNQINWEMYYLMLNKSFQPTPVSLKEKKDIQTIIDKSNEMIMSGNRQQYLDDDSVYREFEKFYNKVKLLQVVDHFLAIPGHPHVIKIIFKKLLNLAVLILLRMRGKKIRW